MTLLLFDASVVLSILDTRDRHHSRARGMLDDRQHSIMTTDLAYYEVGNTTGRTWADQVFLGRGLELLDQFACDGGLIRADADLVGDASRIANEAGISVYDASYVAAARRADAELVSCDEKDLVSRGLARLP